MNRSSAMMPAVTMVGGAALCAQRNPVSADVKADYETIRDYAIRSAEKMPEAGYGFKPSPDVRTFGQTVARQAAYAELEHTLTAKSDLLAALKKAFAYCDGAYDSLTDASASGPGSPC
jgi:hypothetical protein